MKEKISLLGSLIVSLMASICCIGPIVALTGTMLGLSNLSFLDEWRLPLLGLSSVLLVMAIYFTYSRPRNLCTEGECQSNTVSWKYKLVLWSGAIMILVSAALPYYAQTAPNNKDNCCTIKKNASCCAVKKEHAPNCATKVAIKPNAKKLTSLQIDQLKEAFNRESQSVRIIAILSPTCSYCQHGQNMLQKIFNDFSTERLKGFITWTPMLALDDASAANSQATIFQDQRVKQNWDGDHLSGDLFANALNLKRDAWDVYLVYEPGLKWEGATPPQPTFWMHQLKADTGAPQQLCLNENKFSQQIKQLLGKAD